MYQDLQFAIDQLVEIAIRALSPAVNDTFTALACVDWLGDGLTRLTVIDLRDGVHRDDDGAVRLLEPPLEYERLVNRAYDQIRQAGRGLPAVGIRQLDTLTKVAARTSTDEQRRVLRRQALMLLRLGTDPAAVPEENDRADVQRRYDAFEAALGRRAAVPAAAPAPATTAR
jgi:uncharacterized membrane protein